MPTNFFARTTSATGPAEAAAREIARVPVPRRSNVNLKLTIPTHLNLTEESRMIMQEHMDIVGIDKRRYAHNLKEQNIAFQDFTHLGLHLANMLPKDVRTKFAIRHSFPTLVTVLDGETPKKTLKRITTLYQCQCGTDSQERRQIPWKDIHCPCWVRLVTTHDDSDPGAMRLITFDKISGILEHSSACDDLVDMDRNPRIGLHPDLRNHALSLLRDNIPLTQLQQMCKKFSVQHWSEEVGDIYHRFRLNDHDASSLYRMINRERGIHQRSAAEENLELWLRPDNPLPPNPLLTSSVLYYHPFREDVNDRLVIIISTPEMQAAAWKWAHKRHLLMDLTFGFSSARANLLILMGIDDKNKGLPIAMIVFTAKVTARAVHADYDTNLIRFLLEKWRVGMGKNPNGDEFEFVEFEVVTTDNDSRERNALQEVFPGALLLLCMFHVWQAWRNGLNKHLRTIPKGEFRTQIRQRLAKFLMRLLKEITDYDEAVDAYNSELAYFKKLGRKRDDISKRQSKGAMAFLAYLQSYLKLRPWWMAWSKAGALEAGRRLGVHVDKVPRTTNHLEGFNGKIKGKYFDAYQHSGRLPRLDVWLLLMITVVLPAFYAAFVEREQQRAHLQYLRKARILPSTPPPADSDSAHVVPLISPDSDTPHGTDLEVLQAELAMIEEMVEGDDESDDKEVMQEVDEDVAAQYDGGIFGASLRIDEDGMGCTSLEGPLGVDDEADMDDAGLREVEEEGNMEEEMESMWEEGIAVDGSDSDTSISDSVPSTPFVLPLSHGICIPISTSTANAQATAMQEMLVLQDQLSASLRNLRMLNVDSATLDPYIPAFLRDQILHPHTIPNPRPITRTIESVSHPDRQMISRPLLLAPAAQIEDVGMGGLGQTRLLPLPKQVKQRRHEAHGLR